MTTLIRHGGASHFMRPDGVMRTGVVQPVQGYSPAQDVMNVAAEFTNVYGPQMTTPLAGLRGPAMLLGPNIGLFTRARLKFAAWKAQRQAQKFMNGGLGYTPGSGPQMGPQINAMPSSRAAMLSHIAEQNFPAAWGGNAIDALAARWNGRRGR